MTIRVFGESDLHLSFAKPKPMTKFGEQWEGHPDIIAEKWNKIVRPDDIVLIPGDISWASKLDDAISDLFFIHTLHGRKVLIKGNHDYWWQGIKKLRTTLQTTDIYPLRNDCIVIDNIGIIGTKGYDFDRIHNEVSDIYNHDSHHFLREKNRLEMSINDAKKKNPKRLIAMLHYPPFASLQGGRSPMTDMLADAGVEMCAYGHVHYKSQQKKCFQGNLDGVEYQLVTCEYLGFEPKLLIME